MYNSGVDFPNLLAFYPAYSEGGKTTVLCYREREEATLHSVSSLVSRVCREFSLDRRSLANAASFISGSRSLTPLPLALGRTFVPLKCLKPRVPRDPAYGYFLLQSMARIEAYEEGCVLVGLTGYRHRILLTRSAAMQHIARALLFERLFWSRRLGLDYFLRIGENPRWNSE